MIRTEGGNVPHPFAANPLIPFSSCQICMGPEDATVHAQPEGMTDELMTKLRSALRFAASRSVMSSADEQAILAALKATPPQGDAT